MMTPLIKLETLFYNIPRLFARLENRDDLENALNSLHVCVQQVQMVGYFRCIHFKNRCSLGRLSTANHCNHSRRRIRSCFPPNPGRTPRVLSPMMLFECAFFNLHFFCYVAAIICGHVSVDE
jgi:hypothetical protein